MTYIFVQLSVDCVEWNVFMAKYRRFLLLLLLWINYEYGLNIEYFTVLERLENAGSCLKIYQKSAYNELEQTMTMR